MAIESLLGSGVRANYEMNTGDFTLYLDPNQDTVISLNGDCQLDVINRSDDIPFGFSNTVAAGEKSETNGLAQGGFKILFSDWQFTNHKQNPILRSPNKEYKVLVFNGNITRLQGNLNDDHWPESSGNVFWHKNAGQ